MGMLLIICLIVSVGTCALGTAESEVSKEIVIILIIYAVFIVVFNFWENKKLESILMRIEQKEKLNSLLTTVFLGTLLTLVLTNQTNQIAEQQLSIENRETSPAFQIESYEDSETQGYKVYNKKGMASYVTMNVFERYSFQHNGISYEISFLFASEEQTGANDLNEENPELTFLLNNKGFDRERVCEYMEAYVRTQLDDSVYITNSKNVELSFFDYKNERFTFVFSESSGRIHLMNTGEKVYQKKENITMFYGEENRVEEQIEYAVDVVIKNTNIGSAWQ